MNSRRLLLTIFVVSFCDGFSLNRSDQIDPEEYDTDYIWTSWHMITINIAIPVAIVLFGILCIYSLIRSCFSSSNSATEDSAALLEFASTSTSNEERQEQSFAGKH